MSVKSVLNELKELWIDSKESRKAILKAFTLFGNPSGDDIEKNKKRIFNILMWEESVIRNYILDNIWLSDEIIFKIDECLSNRDFYDIKILFTTLRDFLNAHFSSLDMVVYKYNQVKNSLEVFTWDQSLAINVFIDNISLEDNYNEYSAFIDDKNQFIYSLVQDTNFDGWLWSIKLNSWNDKFILSFYVKDFLLWLNNEDINNDILKIKKIFTKYWLLHRLQDIIKYIEAKYKDELTWLLNKAYLNALPENFKTSVLFIDLDRFKSINDNYWHKNWDEVLIKVAKLLNDSVRTRDKVCRISGDEFLVLVPTNNPVDLDNLESRIKVNLNNLSFNFKNNSSNEYEDVKVTATIWKWCNNNKTSLTQIMERADNDMYGKKWSDWTIDRVIFAFEELPICWKMNVLTKSWFCDVSCLKETNCSEKIN